MKFFKLKKSTKISLRVNFYLFVATMSVMLGAYLTYISALGTMGMYHNIDLSLNMLQIFGREEWWDKQDAHGTFYNETSGEYEYLAKPYPVIYIESSQNLFKYQFTGILDGLMLGMGIMTFGGAILYLRSEMRLK